MKNNKKMKRLYRVVTFLKREELDILDELGKDIYFSHGRKVSRAKIIEEIIALFKEKGIEIKDELINKILKARSAKTEQRIYPRLKKHVHVEFRKMDSMRNYTSSVTEDISMGGFRLEVISLDKPLKVGQVLELSISDPDENTQPIKAIGRIAWVREKTDEHDVEVGVMLTYIKKEDHARFNGYLTKGAKNR